MHCKGLLLGKEKKIEEVKKPVYKTIIVQTSLDGSRIIATFDNLTDAADMYDYNAMRILQACKGVRESYKGYKWKFLSVEVKDNAGN